MPTSPFAVAQISVNSGAPASGGLTVPSAATIQLSGTNTSNWTSARWEIYAYPLGWPTPSGWTLDTNTGIIYSMATTPSLITLEAASTRWGKWLVRLIVNGGTKNGVPPVFDPTTGSYLANDVIDFLSGWRVLSPTFGLDEPALYEATQFGGLRRWTGTLQAMIHALEAGLGASHHTWVDTLLDGVATLALTGATNALVDCSGFTADRTMLLPAIPKLCQCVTFKFQDTSLVSHNAIINGNGNSVQGYQTAPAATYTMGNVPWGPYGSATFCFSGTIWETI